METPPVEVVAAYPALFTWILGISLLISVGSMIYHIRRADRNNTEQWAKLDNHGDRISHIEGKCEGNHS